MFQAVVLCQVERAKDAMLNHLYSSIRYIPIEYEIIFLSSFISFSLSYAMYCKGLVFIELCLAVHKVRGEFKSYYKRIKR